jgi:RNA polymerase sigma-70 factor, ECF subfamily
MGEASAEPGTASSFDTTFATIFETETSFVWNTLRRFGVPPRDLEDLSHDVFLTVHRRLKDYDPSRPLRPWLFGIVYRTAWRYRELARNRYELVGAEVDVADENAPADEQLMAHQARQRLLSALETIDLDQRAVFLMHDLEGCPMPEIATTLSIPLNTAYSRLRLARGRVKAALERMHAKEGGP